MVEKNSNTEVHGALRDYGLVYMPSPDWAAKCPVNHRNDIADLTKSLQPTSPRAYEYIVKKYLKQAGIKGAWVHTLRHTFATHHVAKGTSLRTVQEALGHADLKTTPVYVSLAREVMNKELQEHAL